MITSKDLKGIMAMMPAFTKNDGDRIDAMDTVDTDELTRAVDKLIRDGGEMCLPRPAVSVNFTRYSGMNKRNLSKRPWPQ
jgi:hypothetical protein